MKRIGIFQYQWPVKVYTVDLAAKLAENGFLVDLYLYACYTGFVSPSALMSYPNVKVFSEFDENGRLLSKAIGRMMHIFRRSLGLTIPKPPGMDEVVRKTFEEMGPFKYDYFIGIEKNGLIWAGRLSERLNVPFLYYSLELFDDNHPELSLCYPDAELIRREEKKYHSLAAGTIIQDEFRASALFESNGIEPHKTIYIPVSVTGEKIVNKSRFLYERLGIQASKKIVLYLGMIRNKRGVNEIMQCADRLGEDFVIVFHGPLSDDIQVSNSYAGKVLFSTDMVNTKEITKIVSSAHIGVAFYGGATVNDELTAFSSEKISCYMQAGIPIIAHRNRSYELLMKYHHCGELIDNLGQLPSAVEKIDADYSRYRGNAFAAFEHFYSFDINIRSLTEYLSGQ